MAPKKKKKRRRRRKFSDKFKADAVALVIQSGKSVSEVARDLDLGDTVLRGWVKQAGIDAAASATGPLTTGERAELQQLRRDNHRLTMERDFLKKATVHSGGQRNVTSSILRKGERRGAGRTKTRADPSAAR